LRLGHRQIEFGSEFLHVDFHFVQNDLRTVQCGIAFYDALIIGRDETCFPKLLLIK